MLRIPSVKPRENEGYSDVQLPAFIASSCKPISSIMSSSSTSSSN